MKFRKVFAVLLVLVGLFPFAPPSFGFALLGPFASWAEETNGVVDPGDIGGPMDIGSGYRWNVPIVTYGFDQSFLDYFGTNGVAAVEGAFQILNDLPPASDIVLTDYPPDTAHINYAAQALGIYDLKSSTLTLLLEQMGMASPTRYIYVIQRWDPSLLNYSELFSPLFGEETNDTIFNFMARLNFDPETFAPSPYVNGTLYSAFITTAPNVLPGYNFVIPYAVDPFASTYTAVADSFPDPGGFYTGLTGDDVGGLRYLLSADNVHYEQLLPDVRVVGPHKSGIGNEAWRPGVEKITFVRQPTDPRSKRAHPARYRFIDAYLKNNILMHQRAERETRQPDFLFCAADTGENNPYTLTLLRTGTTNWLNNAASNGNTNGEGPGVIQPPIKITFHKLGVFILTYDSSSPGQIDNCGWGSFDNSTNSIVVYPVAARTNNAPLTIRLRFWIPGSTNAGIYPVYNVQLTNHTWHLPVPFGGQASLQISSNQADWTTVATATNAGSVTEWYHYGTAEPPTFFRAIPQ